MSRIKRHITAKELAALLEKDEIKNLDFIEQARADINGRTELYYRIPTTLTLAQVAELLFWAKDYDEAINHYATQGEDWSRGLWLFVKNDYLERAVTALAQIGGEMESYEFRVWIDR